MAPDTLVPRPDVFGPCVRRQPPLFPEGGRPIPGYRWIRVAGVPDRLCGA